MYGTSLYRHYDLIRYTYIVWGSGNEYTSAQHISQHLFSFAISESIHIFYVSLPVTALNLAVL